ncbi:MAG: hypothetical protein HOQ24_18285 [Mycobacteriaceae bacterium]|nr:hypothetical protein [Mycobacteriaceae bacterium]
MDFVDGLINIGVPVAVQLALPTKLVGPVGVTVSGIVGGAAAGYLSALYHGEDPTGRVVRGAVGGALVGFGNHVLTQKLGLNLLGKAVPLPKNVKIVNTLGKVLEYAKPRILPATLMGGAGFLTGEASDYFSGQPVALLAPEDCPDVPPVKKPPKLAPEVDKVYDQLPQFFCRAAHVLGRNRRYKMRKEADPPPADPAPLHIADVKSGVAAYDSTKTSINTNAAAVSTSETQLLTHVTLTKEIAEDGHEAVIRVVKRLNDVADDAPRGTDVNAMVLTAVDKAVKETNDVLEWAKNANDAVAKKVKPPPVPR